MKRRAHFARARIALGIYAFVLFRIYSQLHNIFIPLNGSSQFSVDTYPFLEL